MSEQAYFGTCPAGDAQGLRLSVLVSHPSVLCWPPTLTIGCPRDEAIGEHLLDEERCPEDGTHVLRAVTVDLGEVDAADQAMAWVQSPSDALWHAVRPAAEDCDDIRGEGVTAACGHRLPTAALAERTPGYPACLGCVVQLTERLPALI